MTVLSHSNYYLEFGKKGIAVIANLNHMCGPDVRDPGTMAAKFGGVLTECRPAVGSERRTDQEEIQRKTDHSEVDVLTSKHSRNDTYYCQKDFYVQIQTISILLECNFYFADTSSCEAKQLLKTSSIGTFLIRDSSDPRYLYTISVKTKRGPTSIRVSYEHGRFSFDSDEYSKRQMQKFPSIMDLIDFYVRDSNRQHIGKCRFLDKSGRKDLPIILSEPKLKDVPSLKHLCRPTINRNLSANNSADVLTQVDRLPIPKPLRSYLKDYPYIC